MSRCRLKAPSATFLPDELIVEILSWLTVKPLMRLRCVSKSWNTLISDTTFVQMHLKRSARDPHLTLMLTSLAPHCTVVPFPIRRLIENPSTTVHDPCYRVNIMDRCCWVIGSCNGLLCLLGQSLCMGHIDYWLCFWNPATRTRSGKLGHFGHFFDPLRFKFAFGYDNSIGNYKVVAFRVEGDEGDEASWGSEVNIFSLEDNCWRNIERFPLIPLNWFNSDRNNGVHLNGTLNWLALRNYSSSDCYFNFILKGNWKDINITVEQYVIVSLDLSRETYTQLLLPQGFDEVPYLQPTVGVLMDCLCFSHDLRGTDFVIWLMKDFGVQESWTQLLKISYQNLQIHDRFGDMVPRLLPLGPLPLCLMPLCLSKNGDTLILANDNDDQAIIYNWRDNRVERTRITSKLWKIQWFSTMDYVESLVSVR